MPKRTDINTIMIIGSGPIENIYSLQEYHRGGSRDEITEIQNR